MQVGGRRSRRHAPARGGMTHRRSRGRVAGTMSVRPHCRDAAAALFGYRREPTDRQVPRTVGPQSLRTGRRVMFGTGRLHAVIVPLVAFAASLTLLSSRAEAQVKPFKIRGGGYAPDGLALVPGTPARHSTAGKATDLGHYTGEGLVWALGIVVPIVAVGPATKIGLLLTARIPGATAACTVFRETLRHQFSTRGPTGWRCCGTRSTGS
jgi:hypothetical protein